MSARRHITYVLDSLADDDVGRYVAALLGRLPRSAWEPRVVSLGGSDDLWELFTEMKVSVHRLETEGFVGTMLAPYRLRRLLKHMDVERLHTFQPWSGNVALQAAPGGTPVVRTVRMLDDRHLRGLRGLAERLTGRRADRFVATDEDGMDLVARRYGADDAVVVPECVDVTAVREKLNDEARQQARRALGVREEEFVVACLTDFREEADVDAVLSGFVTARREQPGLRLFMIGTGPREGAARWKAEELHLDDAVLFYSDIPEAPMFWGACGMAVDAGWWPVRPRGVIEALAAEVPAFLRSDGEMEEDGLPAVPENTDQFAVALVQTAREAERRTEALMAGQAVLERHAASRATRLLQEVYAGLLPAVESPPEESA